MKKFLIMLMVTASIFLFSYTLRPGDEVSIYVFGQPELSLQVVVSVDGTISYPFAGEIYVKGKTTKELEEIIREYVKKVIKDPIVTVYISKYAPMYVYIQGAINTSFDISVDNNMTLSKLVSFLNLSTKTTFDFSNIKLKRNNKVFYVNLEDYYNGKFDEDVVLEEGDIIYIPIQKDKVAYITGPVKNPGEFSFSEAENITLSLLLAKAGGILDEKRRYIKEVEIVEDNVSKVYSSDILEKDIQLKRGAIVNIKTHSEFYVYSNGMKIEFYPDEPKTLGMLVAKVLVDVDKQEILNDGFAIINGNKKIPIKGNENLKLDSGDVVDIIYAPFTVNVVGYKGGVVNLTSKEPRTLSYLIKKLGVDDIESMLDVYVSGKSYKIEDLVFGRTDRELEKGETVVIRYLGENVVYIVGDFSSYVKFPFNEKITLYKVLSRARISDLKRIERVEVNGKKLDVTKDTDIDSGTILRITLKKPIHVTVMGYVKKEGTFAFNYTEKSDLITLFGKSGGFYLGPKLYFISDFVYVIRNNKVISKINVEDILEGKKNMELKDGDFVYVTSREVGHVYVFGYDGEERKYSLIKFTRGETFDLKTLIAKLGGIKKGISKKITILTKDGKKTVDWNENVALENGATVLFERDRKNYVYVVDKDGKANTFYLDEPISLFELITNFDVNKNYKKLEVLSDGTKISIDVSDVEKTLGYIIKPGDVVKILDVPQNVAYVLGEVNKPGIISLNKGTTVLEAVIQAGYINQNASLSSVYLYKGGLNGKAIKINLNDVIKNKTKDLVVEPGDIVYVPSDPFKSALDWIPVINNILSLYNNISTAVK